MKKLLLLCGVLAVASISCIKKEYDLNKELDLNIRFGGNVIEFPLGITDSLFLGDFLSVDEVDLLGTIDGNYVILIDSSMAIEIPKIEEFGDISIDIELQQSVSFSDFVELPEMLFPEIRELQTKIDSGLYLPANVVDAIRGFINTSLGGTPINIVQLNNYALNDDVLMPALSAVLGPMGLSVNDYFPLPLISSVDTVANVSFAEPLSNKYIRTIDTVWLEAGSGFNVNAQMMNVPDGIIVRLDTLKLIFPEKVFLDVNYSQHDYITSPHTVMIVKENMENLNFDIPILFFHGVHDGDSVKLDGEIKIYARYSLEGYLGGNPLDFFPSNENQSTRLYLTVTPDLRFGSATVTLNNDSIATSAGLPQTAFAIEINEDIPGDIEILSLDKITFVDTEIDLNFTIAQSGGNIVDNLQIRLVIDFPNEIMFSDPSITGNGNVLDRVVTFDGGQASLAFGVQGMDFSNSTILSGNSINFKDSIVVEAFASLINPTINTSSIQGISLDLDINGGLNINFGKVYAKIRYDLPLDDNISIDLSDLPDILINNRDSLVLDVNPHLSLILNTNLQIPLGAEVVLESHKNNNVINRLEIPINIPATTGVPTETKFWIAGETTLPPNSTYEHIQRNLGSIIKTFPDSIVIRVEGGINDNAIFDFGIDYFANMDYKFVVPLAPGPDFKIVITDTMSLEAFIGEMISGNKIGLTVRALNNIPLDLTVNVIPIGEDNEPIGVSVEPLEIKANTTMASPPATLVFDDKESNKLGEMRGIIFQIKAETGTGMAGVSLRPDNFIQLRLGARIEGGVTVDLRDFFNNDNNE